MQKVVTNIRKLPGLSRFLLSLLFSDLQRAVSAGTCYHLNTSRYSCDALVVFLDRNPVHIPLQIMQEGVRELLMEVHTLTVRAMRDDVTKELAAFLRKLWDQIVSPIVDCLQTTHLNHASPPPNSLSSQNCISATWLKVGQSAAQANAPLLLDLGCCSKLSASCWANQCNLFANSGHGPALHRPVWIPLHLRNRVRCMARLYRSGSRTLRRPRHLPHPLFRRGHL